MERILVVDDDEAICGIVAEVLSDEGHDVVAAASAEDALELFRRQAFSLVMTDIRMSGMDGIELLREIRALEANAAVVIMTSHGSMETAVGALKMGAYDYLTKPFENLDIIATTAARALEHVAMGRERDHLIASLTKSNDELEKLNHSFRELAIRDGLTGLYNHRHLQEVIKAEVDRARLYRRNIAIIFLDVDHFKQYNDTHGHQLGDSVLRDLGRILEENARETDVVARWGGEEFVIVAPETSAEDGAALAEKLRQCVAVYPFKGRDTQPGGRVTISAGVAALAEGGDDDSIVYRADQAVYRAKAAGRNTVCLAA